MLRLRGEASPPAYKVCSNPADEKVRGACAYYLCMCCACVCVKHVCMYVSGEELNTKAALENALCI